MNRKYDVLIVGAGVTGLTVAALLAQCKYSSQLRLTVVDAAPRPVHDPESGVALRVSAIATGSARLLESVGAWQHVGETRASAYETMRVWDESIEPDSGSALRFDAAEFGVPQLGFIVENVLIQHALLAVLDNLDVTLTFNTRIDSLKADLVIGADGSRSFVREKVGIKTQDFPYGQTAFVTHLKPEQPHCHAALQRFTQDGPLGMLPLADGRISVVWSIHDVLAERVQAASDEELGEILSAASDYALGNLEVAGPRGGFPGDRPVLRRYERARKGENATMLHFMTGLNKLFATDSALVRELRINGMRLFNYSGPIRDHAVKVALGI